MKNLLKLSLAFLLLLASCSNEKESPLTPDPSAGAYKALIAELTNSARTAISTNQEDDYLDSGECFEINYPYSVTDGQNTITLNSQQEELDYIDSLSDDAQISIVYPLSVTLSDGSVQTINSEEEFYYLLASCEMGEDGPGGDCFTVNFPITAYNAQGNTVTVNSEQELYSLDLVGFVYPISVTLADGSTVTINSSEDFDSIYNDCYGIDDCENCVATCFDIVFPFAVVTQSGTVSSFNDYDELMGFLSQLSEDDSFVIQYPITVEFEDGTQQSVGSDSELEVLYDSCE